ncbi:hypothetical protein ACIOHE_17530 [Streptomyces sp. NPDC087851]|uniref:hypothetical protein n=1 Tax=Streptomyces sp. NPDC087851 TaxID=3365810 RepID=UPI0038239710
MPSHDTSRARFRLSGDHISVFSHLVTGEPIPTSLNSAEKELKDCGLINDAGEFSADVAPLVATLMDPVAVVTVEMLGEHGRLVHELTISNGYVFSRESWPDEVESSYAQVEPQMLVWALAHMVNLQRADPISTGVPCVESTVGVLDAGLDSLSSAPTGSEESADHVAKALAQTGSLSDPALSLLANMIGELRSSWRMTTAWHGEDEGKRGTKVRGFGIWDCGPLGYWHRELPAEPVLEGQVGPESPLKLVPVPAKRVWEMITGMLPEENEIAHR